MGTSIVFFGSLGGVLVLLGIKVLELKRGVKPLSALRYRLDSYLRRKAEGIVQFARYFNSQTAKLIVFFILSEIKDGIVYLARKVKESYLGDVVRGRNIPNSTSLQSSAYLNEIGAIKVQARDSSK